MENKNTFYRLFKENDGRISEMELGNKMGLSEDETREILAELLSEYKIEYGENGSCEYRLIEKSKKGTSVVSKYRIT